MAEIGRDGESPDADAALRMHSACRVRSSDAHLPRHSPWNSDTGAVYLAPNIIGLPSYEEKQRSVYAITLTENWLTQGQVSEMGMFRQQYRSLGPVCGDTAKRTLRQPHPLVCKRELDPASQARLKWELICWDY